MKKFIIALLVVLAYLLSAQGASAHEREERHHHSGMVIGKPLIKALTDCALRDGRIVQKADDAVHDWLNLIKAVKEGNALVSGTVLFMAAVRGGAVEIYWVDGLGTSGLVTKEDDVSFTVRYMPGDATWWCGL